MEISARLASQMSFLLAADGLKVVDRTCRIGNGSRFETSAEHSWHVALMAMVLSEYTGEQVNMGRVLELLVVHDLVEVYAGDTLIYDAEATVGQAARESAAAEQLFGLLPPDQTLRFKVLWQEFEASSTKESAFARAIDALAPTWIHWGDHADNQHEPLTRGQILAKKTPLMENYPVLFKFLKEVVDSAVGRGSIQP